MAAASELLFTLGVWAVAVAFAAAPIVGQNFGARQADRVRQSLFDILGQRCDGLAVLDLYAGTGALALEAISRGAEAM